MSLTRIGTGSHPFQAGGISPSASWKRDIIDIIAMCIRPPPAENSSERCLNEVYCDRKIVVVGDFNAKLSKSEEDRTIAFLEFSWDSGLSAARDSELSAFNGQMGSSVIDVFATDLPYLVVQGLKYNVLEGKLMSITLGSPCVSQMSLRPAIPPD